MNRLWCPAKVNLTLSELNNPHFCPLDQIRLYTAAPKAGDVLPVHSARAVQSSIDCSKT